MATYSYDLSTEIGQVRFAIGDVPVSGAAFFSDEEIQAVLTMYNSSQPLTAVRLVDTWVFRLALRPKIVIGNWQEDYSGTISSLIKLAAQLRELNDDDTLAAIGITTFTSGRGRRSEVTPWCGTI